MPDKHMKSFVGHIMTLSGKSKRGSQEAKNERQQQGIKGQLDWGFTVIMEWDWGKDLGWGGLKCPLMSKQEAPWLSY